MTRVHSRRVCFLVSTLEPGGIETYLLRFLRYVEGRITPVVICKAGHAGRLHDEYTALGVKVVISHAGYFNPIAWAQFVRTLRQERIETICDFTGNFAGIYVFLGRLAGVPRRIAFYRQSSNHFSETFFRVLYNNWVNRLVDRHSTTILSNSRAGLNFFFPNRDAGDRRFKVVRNGVDTKQFGQRNDRHNVRGELGFSPSDFVVGHTGRYTPAKNHETILQVAKKVCGMDPNVRFLLCGRDIDGRNISGIVDDLGLKGRVVVRGHRSDVNRVLQAMDLFFFPSVTEGQPNSLIEAMVTGVPILASTIEPIAETVPEAMRPLLLEPLDVESACQRILELKHQPEQRHRYCARSWALNKFDMASNFTQFEREL